MYKTTLFRTAQPIDLISHCNSLIRQIKHIRPNHQYFLFQHFENIRISSKFLIFSKYSCGYIEIRRGLDRLTAAFSCQDIPSIQSVTAGGVQRVVDSEDNNVVNDTIRRKEELLPYLKDITLSI